MTLLDLVPPAFALVLHHGRLFDKNARGRAEQIEQGGVGACDRRKEFPAREDRSVSGARRNVGLEFPWLFPAFELRTWQARPREARVDRGQNLVGDRRFRKRQQQRFIQRGGGALGLGIEAADGLHLVAEELDANGPVHLLRVDVQDTAAQSDLAGHLHHIDARVADGEEVLDEHVGQVLFAALEMQGERGIVVAREQAHAGRFNGRDHQACGAAGDLPERCGARLLDFRVWRQVFKRENIVRGKAQHGIGVERTGQLAGRQHGGVQRLSCLVVGDQNKTGGVGRAGEERKIQRAGGKGEAGDASSPAAGT